MKIKAYTIMEVTIAMLLFAIVVSICYTAYGIVSSYYSTFHQKNKTANDIISLKNVMEHDFLKSNCILKSDDGFDVFVDTTKIKYSFTDQGISRTFSTLHTDSFTVVVDKKMTIPMQINKHYSAKDLFN
jgi:Tfp pilus assembly protein PilE